jgi:hypothetical protein
MAAKLKTEVALLKCFLKLITKHLGDFVETLYRELVHSKWSLKDGVVLLGEVTARTKLQRMGHFFRIRMGHFFRIRTD